MAAPTVTYNQLKPMQISNSRFGILTGSINFGNYDNTHPASGIASKFTSGFTPVVMADITANGMVAEYLAGDGFKLWWTGSAVSTALTEVTNGTAAGVSGNFIAIGIMR